MNYTEYLEYLDKPEPKTEPGEWQVDEHGKRYRMVGKVKEYEMTIMIDGHEIPESQLSEFHKRRNEEREKERLKRIEEAKNRPEPRNCPFARTNSLSTCTREKCSIFVDGKCSIAIIADSTQIKLDDAEPKKEKCPFTPYRCNEKCAIYNSGCGIVRIAKAKAKTNE